MCPMCFGLCRWFVRYGDRAVQIVCLVCHGESDCGQTDEVPIESTKEVTTT